MPEIFAKIRESCERAQRALADLQRPLRAPKSDVLFVWREGMPCRAPDGRELYVTMTPGDGGYIFRARSSFAADPDMSVPSWSRHDGDPVDYLETRSHYDMTDAELMAFLERALANGGMTKEALSEAVRGHAKAYTPLTSQRMPFGHYRVNWEQRTYEFRVAEGDEAVDDLLQLLAARLALGSRHVRGKVETASQAGKKSGVARSRGTKGDRVRAMLSKGLPEHVIAERVRCHRSYVRRIRLNMGR